MTATGMPADLPITSSAAEASSSATATSVTCMVRPRASGAPRRSTTPATPATPIATSVRPLRHGRPNVSLTITATSTPRRARTMSTMRRAERSLSTGSSAASPCCTFDRSMPAFAQMKPWLVSEMIRSPRRRTMRTDSCSTSALWASGSSASIATRRPSAFDTTFWVTTSTSPSSSGPLGGALQASATISPSCTPGRISPMPSTPHSVSRLTPPALRHRSARRPTVRHGRARRRARCRA